MLYPRHQSVDNSNAAAYLQKVCVAYSQFDEHCIKVESFTCS
jgi:hypothetical protein